MSRTYLTPIVLPGNPTNPLEAATKQYVDAAAGGVPTTRAINTTTPLAGGGTLAGDLTLTVGAASTSVSGVVGLASSGTVVVGTDALKAITTSALAAAMKQGYGGGASGVHITQTVVSRSNTTYTLLLADAGTWMEFTNNCVTTVPPTVFPAGTHIDLSQTTNRLTLRCGAGVTINGASTDILLPDRPYAWARLTQLVSNAWILTVDPPAGTPADDTITNAKLANMATATIKGRTTAGTGDPEDLTTTQVKAMLGINEITVASSAPGSPAVNDLWVDTT